MKPLTPRIWVAPAMPNIRPDKARVSMITKRGRMPAYRAATGFAPTARISNPSVLRKSSHHTAGTATTDRITPRWTPSPKMIGSALLPRGPVRPNEYSGASSGPRIRYPTTDAAIALSMIVVTTSWAPDHALSAPGIQPQKAPAAMPASRAAVIVIGAGAVASAAPTPAAAVPASRNWPRPPMLNRPALNPIPTPRPPRTRGADWRIVLLIAPMDPNDPWRSAEYAVSGRSQ